MGNDGSLALFATFVAFGVVSITLYLLVLRPILPDDTTAPRAVAGTATNNNPADQRRSAARAPNSRTDFDAGSARTSKSSSIDKILMDCAACPIHLAPSSTSSNGAGMANLLVEGLLAFRHSRASGYEQSRAENEVAAKNRKERARVFSRMLSMEDSTACSGNPPSRGSTIVASIPLAEVACSKLRRVLYMFATYYNFLVILVVPPGTSTADLDKAKAQLRGKEEDEGRLVFECLPDHRIVAASTAAGRIAFVRQLGRVENLIMLDYDFEVATQLKRFGYRVINYKGHLSDKSVSQLGCQLLS